jgi:hypothetical protein
MLRLWMWPAWLKDLGSVALISTGVAIVFTVTASVFEQFHQVAAEDLGSNEIAAVAVGDHTQVLKFSQWGVSLSMPMGNDMATVKYTTEGPDSVGLTSAGVEKIDKVCTAGQNSVGAIVRRRAGAQLPAPVPGDTTLGTIGGYVYTYETPQSVCAATKAWVLANSEAMGIAGTAVLGAQ